MPILPAKPTAPIPPMPRAKPAAAPSAGGRRAVLGVLSVIAALALVAGACSQPSEPDPPEAEGAAPPELAYDFGVDPERRVIRVGMIAELSGPFRFQAARVVDAQLAYWEWLNDRGGVSGWQVEPVVYDNSYDVGRHLEAYEALAGDGPDSVVMLSLSAGTTTTLATLGQVEQDSLAVIPHSYYSGWSDPGIGGNMFELLANYCVESMNGVSFMHQTFGGPMAVVSFPSDYGRDGAQGAVIAAESLGIEIVYDGRGAVVSGGDMEHAISAIVDSNPGWVWLATDPLTTGELMQGAFERGYRGFWSGNSPSWSPFLISAEAAQLVGSSYIVSARTALWDPQGPPGMREMVEAMRQYQPDAPIDDVYAVGWLQGQAAAAILHQAIGRDDLTRAGVLHAAGHTTVDPGGLAPAHSWTGQADKDIIRHTYLYEIANLGATMLPSEWVITSTDSGTQLEFSSTTTVSDETAGSIYSLIQGPYTSPTAQNWKYQPCTTPA